MTTMSDPLIGAVVDRRYRVEERIAKGGMATVYRAHDTRLDRSVALKAMHPDLVDDEDFVARFIREARAAVTLSHPNVVAAYDQGSADGVVYMTMEPLSGRTTRDMLDEQGHLEPNEALRILESVLAALSAAHQAGLVHRDVKPENVLLAEGGRFKVADFGLARAIAGSNHTKTSGMLIGTVAYLSPEQVARGDADARSDVYSAGILLFELLTGQQPLRGETPLEVAHKHVNEDVPLPSSYVPGLPAEVDQLVITATQRHPDRRPSDASGLLALTTKVRGRLSDRTSPETEPHEPPATAGTVDSEGPFESARPSWRNHHETLVVRPSEDDIVPGLASPGRDEETHAGEAAGGTPKPTPWQRSGQFFVRRKGVTALAVVLVLALVAGGAGWYYMVGRWTETPKLTTLSREKATQKAQRLGFETTTGERRFSRKVPKGHVIATRPEVGERILEGGTITLILSQGRKHVAVPKVRGEPPEAAKRKIRRANLKVRKVTHTFSPKVPPGKVLRTKPHAGKKLVVGAKVTLVVSSGVKIPNVTGEMLEDARTTLTRKGFEVDVTKKYSKDISAGVVISQKPSRGGARKGSTVHLTVSKGARPVPVPDVTGMSTSEATQKLYNAGFEVRVKDYPIPGSKVFNQTPQAGSLRVPGTTVTIYAM